jgi:hypothetical protein
MPVAATDDADPRHRMPAPVAAVGTGIRPDDHPTDTGADP